MIKFLKPKVKETLILLAIVTLAVFLRFYKLNDLFVFTTDEEYAVYLAQTIVQHFHIIWIGENAANTGFYMGPFWVYFTALWLFLSKGGVWILSLVVSSLGVITCLTLFLITRKIFGLTAAVVASLLYTTLPLTTYFDRKYWLLSPAPLISILLFFSLYQTRVKVIYWVLIGFLYGMVFHVHLSLVPFGLPIIFLLWQQKKSLLKSKKIILLALTAFLITISPLIVFDYFHKASNITTPFRIGKEVTKTGNSIDPLKHLDYLLLTYGRLWYLSPDRSNSDEVLHACNPLYTNKSFHIPGQTSKTTLPSIFFSLLSVVVFIYFILKKDFLKNNSTRLLIVCFSLLILAFLLLPNVPLEYYLLASLPLFLMMVGVSFSSLNNVTLKTCFTIFLIVISIFGIRTVLTATNEFGLKAKINLVKKISNKIGNNDFELRETGLCHGNEGWRYLFKQYGKRPVKSSVDDSMSYLYPSEIISLPTKYSLVITESRDPGAIKIKDAMVFEEGGFKAYLKQK